MWRKGPDDKRRLVIGVDFDGTLFRPDENGELMPVHGAVQALVALKAENYKIVIHTCRTGLADAAGSLDDEVTLISGLLDEHGMPFDEIHLGEKLVADAYVDDRAVAFDGNWSNALSELKRRLGK